MGKKEKINFVEKYRKKHEAQIIKLKRYDDGIFLASVFLAILWFFVGAGARTLITFIVLLLFLVHKALQSKIKELETPPREVIE